MSSNKYADLIINMYSSLQQNIFNIIINALKNSKYQNVNKDNIMQWQLEQFAKAGKLTDQVINEVAKV
ncbi:MAG: capsid protein, partial [Leuconostoc mesenteroides]